MESNGTAAQPKKRLKTFLWVGMLFIIVAIFLSNLVWKMSGSNQWEMEIEGNGVKIYSLKSPGSSLKKIRAMTRVKSSLGSLIAFFQDPSICAEFGCTGVKVIEKVNAQLFYLEFQYPFPSPLKAREFVTKSLYYQDPATKEVHYYHTAAPEKAPADSCCFRVTHFYVVWKFTPLKNGEIEIEMMRDFDAGGYMPDFLLNMEFPGGAYDLFSRLQGFLDREKYKNAKFDYIEELPAD